MTGFYMKCNTGLKLVTLTITKMNLGTNNNQNQLFFKIVILNPLSAKFIKWSNTLKQFVGNLPTNCLSVFDYFSGLALKGLRISQYTLENNCVGVSF